MKSAIVQLYNSTSELQRRVVFKLDRAGITDIAVKGATETVPFPLTILMLGILSFWFAGVARKRGWIG